MRRILIFLFWTTTFLGCKKGVNKSISKAPIVSSTNSNQFKLDATKSLKTIAFGSCNHEDEPQPLWSDIAAENPDLWIWIGDSIYGDSEDPSVLRSKYMMQRSNPGYAQFISQVPVVGIWDDHDYGVNNGDSTYPIKQESRDAFYDFLEVPSQSPMRKRKGAYQSYSFSEGDVSVKLILLDTRYFKDPIKRIKGEYILDPSKDILGETQWKWLESEMKGNQDLFIIANGTQVIPKEHAYEKWANYPTSRDRLIGLCAASKSEIVLLSGDRHFGEISTMSTSNYKSLYEVTSSGMTHTYEELEDEPNMHRYGTFTNQYNYGVIKLNDDNIILQLKGAAGVLRNELVIKI